MSAPQTADRALHVHRFGGDGAPVVVLHGFLGSGADFSGAADALGRPVLAPDLPGHSSPCPLGPEAYTFDGWPDALARTLDAHGVDRAPFIAPAPSAGCGANSRRQAGA